MKINLFVLLLFCLTIQSSITAQGKDSLGIYAAVTKFDPSRNPERDLKDAVVEAQKSKRRIILDVGGDWCIWCHRIDNFIDSSRDISSELHNHFIVVKVNFSPENKNEKFLSKYPKIPGYPHFFVLSEKGKLIHSQDTGKLEEGKGYSKEKFITFLKKWSLSRKAEKT
jgi:thioredoxin-related protein